MTRVCNSKPEMVRNGYIKFYENRTPKIVGEITFIYARGTEGNLIELQSW